MKPKKQIHEKEKVYLLKEDVMRQIAELKTCEQIMKKLRSLPFYEVRLKQDINQNQFSPTSNQRQP